MPYYRITYCPDTDEYTQWRSQAGQQLVWADACTISRAQTSARWIVHISRGKSGVYRYPVLTVRLRTVARIEEVPVKTDGEEGWRLTWEQPAVPSMTS